MNLLAQLQIPSQPGALVPTQPGTRDQEPGTPPQAAEDIRDIAPPDELPDYLDIALNVLLLSLATFILVYAVVLLLRWRRRRLAAAGIPPPPAEVARAALELLQANAPNLSPNEFGLETSNIIKRYFHDRYNDPLLFETSEEFAIRESHDKIPQGVRAALHEFFAQCDVLKFAATPENDLGDTAGVLFEQATALINETPVPEAIIAEPHYVTSSPIKILIVILLLILIPRSSA